MADGIARTNRNGSFAALKHGVCMWEVDGTGGGGAKTGVDPRSRQGNKFMSDSTCSTDCAVRAVRQYEEGGCVVEKNRGLGSPVA